MKPLTLSEWNSAPAFRTELDNFLRTPTGKALMEVLQNSVPKLGISQTPDPTHAAVILGYQNAWLAVVDTIYAMSNEMKTPETVEEDWGTGQ